MTDTDAEAGEQEAMSALFAGAIGVFKNPISHRTVNYDDPLLAAEAVLLADLLLRLIRRSPGVTRAGEPASTGQPAKRPR